MAGNLEITLSDRLRKSPYYEATLRSGAKSFTIYNRMLMPVVYEGSDNDYWNLINNVTLWDVAAERQVEITGSDAYRFVEYMTPRDLSNLQIGQGKYALILMKTVVSSMTLSYCVWVRAIFGFQSRTMMSFCGLEVLPVDLVGISKSMSLMSPRWRSRGQTIYP